MADGVIDMIIPEADFDTLTATDSKVSQGKEYVGKDGVAGIGENPVQDAPSISLPLNGVVILPAGKYMGGSVGQQIPAFSGMHILPGSEEISIPTKDMYMVGVINIDLLETLVPENIKEGEYVGGVGPGTWKGYVVENQKDFYYRGTFAPGQALEDYVDAPHEETYKLKRTNTDRDIHFYAQTGRGKSNWCVFSKPIDLTGIRKLKIQVINKGLKYSTDDSSLWIGLYRNKYTSEPQVEQPIVYKLFNFTSANNEKIEDLELDLSSYSRSAYLNLSLSVKLLAYMHVRIIQFE